MSKKVAFILPEALPPGLLTMVRIVRRLFSLTASDNLVAGVLAVLLSVIDTSFIV